LTAQHCCSLASGILEGNSKLKVRADFASQTSSVQYIGIPSPVEVIGALCLNSFASLCRVDFEMEVEVMEPKCSSACESLRSIKCSFNSKLQPLEMYVFRETAIQAVMIPNGGEVIDERCFVNCPDLAFISFEDYEPYRPLHLPTRDVRRELSFQFATNVVQFAKSQAVVIQTCGSSLDLTDERGIPHKIPRSR
jgi:hypothetical protein